MRVAFLAYDRNEARHLLVGECVRRLGIEGVHSIPAVPLELE